MFDVSSEIGELGEEFYVVAAKNVDGKWVYFRGTTLGEGLTDHPSKAAQFPLNHERPQLLAWIDDQITKIKSRGPIILMDTVCLVIYRSSLEIEDLSNHDWRNELRRRAVSKLTPMEIAALDLGAVEMERRLAAPPEPSRSKKTF